MTKVYVVMVKCDGSPPTIECIKRSECSAYKYASDYAKKYKMKRYYATTPEEFYANDGDVMTVFGMELED